MSRKNDTACGKTYLLARKVLLYKSFTFVRNRSHSKTKHEKNYRMVPSRNCC